MEEKRAIHKLDASITIRVNKEIKTKAQEVFNELGMDMSTAVNVFLRKAIEYRGFPFEVRIKENICKSDTDNN